MVFGRTGYTVVGRANSSAVERWLYKPDVGGSKPSSPTGVVGSSAVCRRLVLAFFGVHT